MNKLGVKKFNVFIIIGLGIVTIIFITNYLTNIKTDVSSSLTTSNSNSAKTLSKIGIDVGLKNDGSKETSIVKTPSEVEADANAEEIADIDNSKSTKPKPQTSPKIEDNSITTSNKIFIKEEYIDELYKYTKTTYKQPSSSQKDSKLPTILILSTIAKDDPYGNGRQFKDYINSINTLVNTEPTNKFKFSLGLSINSPQNFLNLQKFIEENDSALFEKFEKISLVSSEEMEKLHEVKFSNDQELNDEDLEINRFNRQQDNKQRIRRRIIAKNRNFLISNTLENEQYIIFIDSDVEKFDHSSKFIDILIKTGKDIIVPRIYRGESMNDYDRNSWRGERTKPTEEQLKIMDLNLWSKFDYVPRDKENIWHFYMFDSNSQDDEKLKAVDYSVPLDSVGGAFLFFKSIIYKQGVIFPTNYIIGTNWERLEGYDGIETEGICYLARPLGYTCWGLPNLNAYHVP
ncbi:uncharacterized protein KGF55_001614 [Candida pseudojiufengensis]|uniref:uncharacterized protein n=1 Tax=Candida pseudojiufengensis TaxID=497109 RepID=UPI0022240D1F|nr:uncharacterized protein KGF55_001614 [Candida pseudojiufengensis]KAI5965393.1 hypothetical protein KGF55_001614 [Candida pseudojiufengensis]